MRKLLFAIMAVISLAGCGDDGEDAAYKFVVGEVQDKQGLFRDQYKLSAPILNDRGAVVLLQIVDSNLAKKRAGILYILKRDQQLKFPAYQSQYTRFFLNTIPRSDEIKRHAKEASLL
jgi:hypothetical protein